MMLEEYEWKLEALDMRIKANLIMIVIVLIIEAI